MAEEPELTSAERRRVRRYYALSALGLRGYGYILLVMAEFLLLSMLDDLVFHAREPFLLGWVMMLAVVIALTVLVCWSIVVRNYLPQNKRWHAIEHKARAIAQEQGRPTRIDRSDKNESPLALSARRVAEMANVSLPSPIAFRRGVLAAALALLAVVYAVRFVGLATDNRRQQEAAAQTVSSIEAGLESAGLDAYGADPLDGYDESGYGVSGRIDSEGDRSSTSYVRLYVDNEGQITEVEYTLPVDPERPLDETLAHAEADLAVLHAAVTTLDVPTAAPGLLSYGELPEKFRDTYLAGSADEEVFLSEDDLGTSGGAELNCSYLVTIDEGEFLDSTIWLTLEAPA